jgi:hypothetical protein
MTELAARLKATPTEPVLLAAASAHLQAGGGEALFDALLDASGGDARAMMVTLEAMFDARPAVAGYLMARLLHVAAHQEQHAVYDAIGLWLDDCADPALAAALTRLADEDVRRQLAGQCRAWAARIASRAADSG